MPEYTENIECARRYHKQTKHRLEHYANGPETLDWSMQPDPFRNYQGVEKFPLPFSSQNLGVKFSELFIPNKIAPKEINLNSIGTLLELSMGLSAWKEYQGDRWALRCNPSSGNLHPTEAYLIAVDINNLRSGVYHYLSYEHALEQRCVFAPDENLANSANNNVTNVMLGLSSVFWREAWKYGERAFRYCQLDVGHAVAAIRYACAVLGWSAELVSTVSDDSIADLLGLNRDQDFGSAEREHPDVLLSITSDGSYIGEQELEELIRLSQQGQWFGHANRLDKKHLYDWPIIDEVAHATRRLNSEPNEHWTPSELPSPLALHSKLQAKDIIQRRRSAQKFDNLTAIESDDFYRLLDMVVPREKIPPWDALPWQPKIHLVLFVHRVNGLEPGLYILLRNAQALNSLKLALIDKLEWMPIDQAPDHLNLYRLVKANSQKAAATLSCHQRIASDSAFSLGMLSEFDTALKTGPWAYKHLYWEAGMLGQVLYLEAEAIDLQGTGIGCFFDDPFHEMMGINDTQYQSVYHFTVGGALNDGRLRTIAPYAHLNRNK